MYIIYISPHHSECLICESNIWHLSSVFLEGKMLFCVHIFHIYPYFTFFWLLYMVWCLDGVSMVGSRKSILGLDCLRLTPPSTSCTTCTAVWVLTLLCPVHRLSSLTSYVITPNPHHCYCFGSLGADGCDNAHDALAVTCCDSGKYPDCQKFCHAQKLNLSNKTVTAVFANLPVSVRNIVLSNLSGIRKFLCNF
jgi:hypothetical protein